MTDTEWASHPYYDTPEDDYEDHLDYREGPTDDDKEWINDEDDEDSARDEHDDTLAIDEDYATSASDDDEEDGDAWANSPYY